uniref:Immunoglobulin subtype domain-containing protein n=1 Tax=Oncorhynchus mykiss TaxID=8022 RepID=A0A8K9X5N4_ONCMY
KIHVFFLFKKTTTTVNAEVNTLTGRERQSVTLHTGLTGLQADNIFWFFGPFIPNTSIVESQVIRGENITEFKGRFREKLQLDRETGSLTIRNLTLNNSGFGKRITVCAVILMTQLIDHGMESSRFTFQPYFYTLLECINCKEWQLYIGENITEFKGRFREKLQLDRETGSLTIRNLTLNNSGVYQLDFFNTHKTSQRFYLTVYGEYWFYMCFKWDPMPIPYSNRCDTKHYTVPIIFAPSGLFHILLCYKVGAAHNWCSIVRNLFLTDLPSKLKVITFFF